MARPHRAVVIHLNSPAAYPPLLHFLGVLLEQGWSLRLIGAAGADGLMLPPALAQRIAYVDLGRRAPGRDRHSFLLRLLGAVGAALRERPGLLIASDPDAAVPALSLAAIWKVPIVYLEHDSPCPDPRGDRGRLRRSLRRLLIGQAALRVFPNPARLAFAHGELGFPLDEAVVMPNLPMVPSIPPRPAIAQGGQRRLHFHGSISPGALPLTLVAALARRPNWRMAVYGYAIGHQAHLQALLAAASAAGLADRLCFHGPRPNAELHSLLTAADAAFAGFRCHPFNLNHTLIDGASNKLHEYAWHGLPTLLPAEVPLDQFPAPLAIPYQRDDVESMIAALDLAATRRPDPRWRPADFAQVCRERLLPRLTTLLESA
ncbi:MAG: hypothetical protein MUE46_06890 [Xanthomonadales bacterium]|jgi:hypothetical protein|nr:hypothetical protein [Xanthomonadales bacterium]